MDHPVPMFPYCPQSRKNSLQVFHRVCFSFFLYLLRREASHCWIVVLLKSDEWRAKAEPCQQALVKGQNRNRCVVDSSSALQKGHKLWVVIPLLFRLRRVGNLLSMSFYTKVLIFRGTLTPQINFHTPSCGWVCLCVVEQFFTKISYADLTLYSPSFEYFQKSLSWTGSSLVPLLSCINHIMQTDCERR